MREALAEASAALKHDDVPIGAVVAIGDELVARGRNERELMQDPTAHAEILALRRAAEHLGHWRVLDASRLQLLDKTLREIAAEYEQDLKPVS